MKLSIYKELHLSPWELVCALRTAGLVDQDACGSISVRVVEKTNVNDGRTVVIGWNQQERTVEMKKDPAE